MRRSICHCLACQRRTGSAFGLNAHWPSERVRIEGESRSFTRSGDEGYWARTHFCPDCGATVFYEIERRPGVISIPVGAFADPCFPEPSVAVYSHRRHPWLRFETALPLVEE
ncbi:MAG TPA: GFA family protein [Allosphingosinicella sp.]|nr:GFA family protein [Allosphingosinicella sp.]